MLGAVEHEALTHAIIGAALRVHGGLGPGFLESVYQHALAHELREAGVAFACGYPLHVRYRGALVGEFVADVFVDGRVVVENKAVRALTAAHEAQLVNYLAATGVEIGLLLNFGAERLQVRRMSRAYRAPVAGRVPQVPERLRRSDTQDETG